MGVHRKQPIGNLYPLVSGVKCSSVHYGNWWMSDSYLREKKLSSLTKLVVFCTRNTYIILKKYSIMRHIFLRRVAVLRNGFFVKTKDTLLSLVSKLSHNM